MFDTSRYFPNGYFMNNYFPRYWWFKPVVTPLLARFITFVRVLVG